MVSWAGPTYGGVIEACDLVGFSAEAPRGNKAARETTVGFGGRELYFTEESLSGKKVADPEEEPRLLEDAKPARIERLPAPARDRVLKCKYGGSTMKITVKASRTSMPVGRVLRNFVDWYAKSKGEVLTDVRFKGLDSSTPVSELPDKAGLDVVAIDVGAARTAAGMGNWDGVLAALDGIVTSPTAAQLSMRALVGKKRWRDALDALAETATTTTDANWDAKTRKAYCRALIALGRLEHPLLADSPEARRLADARAALEDGRPSDALARLRSDSPYALQLRAQAALVLGDLTAALDYAHAAVSENAPAGLLVRARILRASNASTSDVRADLDAFLSESDDPDLRRDADTLLADLSEASS